MNERIALVGSGAIACGLAATAAAHGNVVLWARSDASAQRARGTLEKLCGRMDGVEASDVTVVTDLAAVASATFVVEAIAEDLPMKAELLGRVLKEAAPDAIIATTTSSLSVQGIADAVGDGIEARFVGLHVFNPVTRMKLVELAYPGGASEATRERALALCADLGKTAVEVPDTAGFVVNRLLFPYLFDAVRYMDESGLAPEAVDTCMTLGTGHPMGPLALLDFIGLDVSLAIGEAIGTHVPDRVRDLVAAGKLGRKSGEGIYPVKAAV